MIDKERFEKLLEDYPKAKTVTEGAEEFIFLPHAKVTLLDGNEAELDMLLCPHLREGKPTRLYFSKQLKTRRPRNWGPSRILEKEWHAISWNGVEASLSYSEMIAEHIGALIRE